MHLFLENIPPCWFTINLPLQWVFHVNPGIIVKKHGIHHFPQKQVRFHILRQSEQHKYIINSKDLYTQLLSNIKHIFLASVSCKYLDTWKIKSIKVKSFLMLGAISLSVKFRRRFDASVQCALIWSLWTSSLKFEQFSFPTRATPLFTLLTVSPDSRGRRQSHWRHDFYTE